MGHSMGMNDTNQYKLPAIGQGKMGKHEFEWTIVEKWALVKFPGLLPMVTLTRTQRRRLAGMFGREPRHKSTTTTPISLRIFAPSLMKGTPSDYRKL